MESLGLLLLFGTAAVAIIIALVGLISGLAVLNEGLSHAGEARWLHVFFAIHLVEPALNMPLVSFLMERLDLDSGATPLQVLLATMPIAILLIPLLGLAFKDDEYRWTAIFLVGVGLLRWLNSWGMIMSYLSDSFISLILLNTGTVLLIACFVWYARELAELRFELGATQSQRG